jgi:raffinose/stachyose/melibiose transport system substrate-binding protein
MDAVVAAFEEEHPDIDVTVTYADTDQLQSTLRTQLSSGTGPDVFTVWPGNGNPGALQVLQPAGYLADLSDLSFAGRIAEGDRSVTQVDGKTYLVPVTYSGIGAIYNTATLAEIGGTVPNTYSQLLGLCDLAREQGKVLFALGNQTPWVTQLVDYALAATLVYADDPDFDSRLSAGEATFADSAWRQAMEQYLEMNERGCFSDSPLGTSYEASISAVAQGDAVGVIQVATSLSQVRAEAGDAAELDMFAVPATDDPDDTRMPASVSAAYGVNAGSDRMDDARAFVEFLGSAEGQRIYATEGGTLPALPGSAEVTDPALATLTGYQSEGRTVPFMDQRWPNPEVQQAHFTAVQELFTGAAPEDVLADMDAAARR